MTKDELYALGKKEIDYDRQAALFGFDAADNVLAFWILGFQHQLNEVDELARFILAQCPGYPKEGGAASTAIQIIADYQQARNNFKAISEDQQEQITKLQAKIDELKEKADHYDKIEAKLQEFYTPGKEPADGLITIGEYVAGEMGFLG